MKPIMSLSWSTTLIGFLIAQVVMIVYLSIGLAGAVDEANAVITSLPPVSFLYDAVQVSWIGVGVATALSLTCILNMMIGLMCIEAGWGRKLKAIKYVLHMIGAHFILIATACGVFAGVVLYGGYWHLIAFAVMFAAVALAVGAALTFAMLKPALSALGRAHDSHILEQIADLLEKDSTL